ncbi:MAG: hypothetical protein QNI99_14745 [Woeseiaceae bacterium]|nr:hypothetical protein [Woeseiaceae bacterium]
MNPVFAHRVHIGAIGALMIVVLTSVFYQFGIEYAPGYAAYNWFGVLYGAIVALLLGVRLRQLLVQAIVVDANPGIESFAVNTGQALIVLGVLGLIAAFFSNFIGGLIRTALISNIATASLWVGLACIELVIANGRSAVLPRDERPSGTARILMGLFILFVGFLLGVSAVFGFFFIGLSH